MSIRRKKTVREKLSPSSRADLFHRLEGQSAVTDAVSTAATDLQLAVTRAREAVAEAEQAMATGARPFQEAIESCSAASKSAADMAANSVATGEAGAKRAIDAMMENLQRVSAGFSSSATSQGSPGTATL